MLLKIKHRWMSSYKITVTIRKMITSWANGLTGKGQKDLYEVMKSSICCWAVVTRQDSPNGAFLNLYILLLINSISVEK